MRDTLTIMQSKIDSLNAVIIQCENESFISQFNDVSFGGGMALGIISVVVGFVLAAFINKL